jgi:hypothetical protein
MAQNPAALRPDPASRPRPHRPALVAHTLCKRMGFVRVVAGDKQIGQDTRERRGNPRQLCLTVRLAASMLPLPAVNSPLQCFVRSRVQPVTLAGRNRVRSGLAPGGRWIRTIGTASESCLDFGNSVHPRRYLQARTPPPDADEAVCDHCGLRCVERRLAAHDALDGLTSRTLREPARDTAVRSLLSRPFPAA